MTDIAASVLAKLKNRAKAAGISYAIHGDGSQRRQQRCTGDV